MREEVGAGPTSPRLAVDGVELAYDDEGAGATVVCLHAIGHGARDFAPLRERLGPRCRIIALDWPGQGRSAPDRVPPSVARYTALLTKFLDALGIERAVVVGNSIGGNVAIRYAAAHPERVRALVLADPAGLDPGGWLARLALALHIRFFAAGARGARWFAWLFARYYKTVLPARAAAQQRRRIVASAYEVAPLLRDAWRSFGEPDNDARALIPVVRCPVLFAWSEKDRVIQLRRNVAAIRRFAGGRLAVFPGGHAAHLEAPDAFAAAVAALLDELSRSSGTADSSSLALPAATPARR